MYAHAGAVLPPLPTCFFVSFLFVPRAWKTEVTSGVLKMLYARASALKSDLVDFQAQGQSAATDFGIVNDIQLMINISSMLRALRYNAITMEHQLGDGHSK